MSFVGYCRASPHPVMLPVRNCTHGSLSSAWECGARRRSWRRFGSRRRSRQPGPFCRGEEALRFSISLSSSTLRTCCHHRTWPTEADLTAAEKNLSNLKQKHASLKRKKGCACGQLRHPQLMSEDPGPIPGSALGPHQGTLA